jgi:hypothetical protein
VDRPKSIHVSRSTLFSALRRLGCESLETRKNGCDFWQTMDGTIISIMDGERTMSNGEILYDVDYARDLVSHVMLLNGDFSPDTPPGGKKPGGRREVRVIRKSIKGFSGKKKMR